MSPAPEYPRRCCQQWQGAVASSLSRYPLPPSDRTRLTLSDIPIFARASEADLCGLSIFSPDLAPRELFRYHRARQDDATMTTSCLPALPFVACLIGVNEAHANAVQLLPPSCDRTI
jgi:hypothetical protein